jgi:hypothetical protein
MESWSASKPVASIVGCLRTMISLSSVGGGSPAYQGLGETQADGVTVRKGAQTGGLSNRVTFRKLRAAQRWTTARHRGVGAWRGSPCWGTAKSCLRCWTCPRPRQSLLPQSECRCHRDVSSDVTCGIVSGQRTQLRAQQIDDALRVPAILSQHGLSKGPSTTATIDRLSDCGFCCKRFHLNALGPLRVARSLSWRIDWVGVY